MLLLKGQPGLSDLLASDQPLIAMAAARDPQQRRRWSRRSAGRPAALNPAELLGGPRLAELLAWAETLYDQILIDTPPLLATSDATIVGRLVDGAVLVVQPMKNPRRTVVRAAEAFTGSKINLLGVVLNRVGSDKNELYGYTAGYGYGYGYGYDDQSADEPVRLLDQSQPQSDMPDADAASPESTTPAAEPLAADTPADPAEQFPSPVAAASALIIPRMRSLTMQNEPLPGQPVPPAPPSPLHPRLSRLLPPPQPAARAPVAAARAQAGAHPPASRTNSLAASWWDPAANLATWPGRLLMLADGCFAALSGCCALFHGWPASAGRIGFRHADRHGGRRLARPAKLASGTWVRSPGEYLILAGTVLVVLQLVPLPESLHHILSPHTEGILPLWSATAEHGGGWVIWSQVSLTPEATRSGLVMFLAYGLLYHDRRATAGKAGGCRTAAAVDRGGDGADGDDRPGAISQRHDAVCLDFRESRARSLLRRHRQLLQQESFRPFSGPGARAAALVGATGDERPAVVAASQSQFAGRRFRCAPAAERAAPPMALPADKGGWESSSFGLLMVGLGDRAVRRLDVVFPRRDCRDGGRRGRRTDAASARRSAGKTVRHCAWWP